MREYETTFIIQPEISDEAVQALCDRLDGILEKHESARLLYDDQGRRRLAYEIQSFQKGRYITLSYLDGGPVVAELERTLRFEDSVLRFLTVQVDEEVKDVDQRRAEAAELEQLRAQKAAERAAREAEEAALAAQAEAQASEAAAKAAAEAAAVAEEKPAPEVEDIPLDAGAPESASAGEDEKEEAS